MSLLRAACAALTAAAMAAEASPPATPSASMDPLGSPAWEFMRARYFKDAPVRFDGRVIVLAPRNAEDALEVPVSIEAPQLTQVEAVVVIADLNPIQKILELKPAHARAAVSFRFKVEQSTPIRAAMRTTDGVWHVGGVWLSAAGGGCTTPSGASRGVFEGEVGAMRGRLWPQGSGERLRLRVVHPMDTGLASGIPAFYMDHLVVRDAAGVELAVLDAFEPVGENPVLTLDLDGHGPVHVDGHDIQGNRFAADVTP